MILLCKLSSIQQRRLGHLHIGSKSGEYQNGFDPFVADDE
jgi:hypothetical protein